MKNHLVQTCDATTQFCSYREYHVHPGRPRQKTEYNVWSTKAMGLCDPASQVIDYTDPPVPRPLPPVLLPPAPSTPCSCYLATEPSRVVRFVPVR